LVGVENYECGRRFEDIENRGHSVGTISAMNAANRMANPAFFIRDPWAVIPTNKSFVSSALALALSQIVNDNTSGRITAKSMLSFALAIIALVLPSRYFWFCEKLLWALVKPWRKAMFLDLLVGECFSSLLKRKRPEFSALFLNGGAHIQQYYMLSSPVLTDTVFRNPD